MDRREHEIEQEVRESLPPPPEDESDTLEKMKVRQAQLKAVRRMMEIESDLQRGKRA